MAGKKEFSLITKLHSTVDLFQSIIQDKLEVWHKLKIRKYKACYQIYELKFDSTLECANYLFKFQSYDLKKKL